MKKCIFRLKYLLAILFVILLSSCNNNSKNNSDYKLVFNNTLKPGFVLTFDDAYVDDWFKIKDLLKKYNVKATFFISGFSNLDAEEISKLKILQKNGHEIGSHSVSHLNAVNFIANKNINKYLDTDILPELKVMRKHGFHVTSFSYPYGANSKSIDASLLKYFSQLRDVSESQRHFYSMFFKSVNELDEIYFGHNSSRVVSALGIDNNFNITIDEIKKGFERAKKNNEIIIFYAHRPVKKIRSAYQISYIYLESIFKAADKIGLTSYRFNNLSDMYNPK